MGPKLGLPQLDWTPNESSAMCRCIQGLGVRSLHCNEIEAAQQVMGKRRSRS